MVVWRWTERVQALLSGCSPGPECQQETTVRRPEGSQQCLSDDGFSNVHLLSSCGWSCRWQCCKALCCSLIYPPPLTFIPNLCSQHPPAVWRLRLLFECKLESASDQNNICAGYKKRYQIIDKINIKPFMMMHVAFLDLASYLVVFSQQCMLE